jgi:hypothetical protein
VGKAQKTEAAEFLGYRTWEGQTVTRGRRIESVMIGKMPGRQIIVYDKAREIRVHEKPYWWHFWGLDEDRYDGEVWRVEIRAGKDELDNWNLRSFENFERIAGGVILHTLQTIRLTHPTDDSEASRWPNHPLWDLAIEASDHALAPYRTAVQRGKVAEGLRAGMIEHFRTLFPSLFASYAHLQGYRPNDLAAVIDRVRDETIAFATKNPRAMADKFQRAAERYALLR